MKNFLKLIKSIFVCFKLRNYFIKTEYKDGGYCFVSDSEVDKYLFNRYFIYYNFPKIEKLIKNWI